MKVGLITYGLDRPLNGLSRYATELLQALSRLTGEVELILLNAGRVPASSQVDGIRSIMLPSCRLLPGLLTLGNAMTAIRARQLNLDVVHDPTGVTPFLFGAGGTRIVVTVHDVFAWSSPGMSTMLDAVIYRYWLPCILRRADIVITDSQASRRDIVQFLGVANSRIRVIPLGLSKNYKPVAPTDVMSARARFGLPQNYILFVGSIEKRKNVHGLLQAFAQVKKRNCGHALVIVGARRLSDSAILEALSSLRIEKDVILTGYVPEEDLPALYAGADLFVFPSFYEGFGLPPLEAMACGTPVVTSNVSSLPEVVGDAALTVDPKDIESLAESMYRILADPGLALDLKEKGLRRAARFTWERVARETLNVYSSVLGKNILKQE